MERAKFIVLVLCVSHIVIPFVQDIYDGIRNRHGSHHSTHNNKFADSVLTYINFVLDVIIVNEIVPYVYRYFDVR